jgi:hypothetical protein
MDMGVLRWIFGSHRSEDDEEDPEDGWKKGKKSRRPAPHSGGYRIEMDGESKSMRGEGPPFSFWSSARVILILSFLLWWIQPAGPMIAGYVGGRRSGSAMKGVLAALMPVAVVLIANTAYTRGVGSTQMDLVASLPDAFAGGVASVLPFLMPYKDFLVGYMSGFVRALQSTFGMGTNGYLMVLIFAYIGGLIADQTRRELYYKSGSSQSVGFNLIQPLLGGRHVAADEEVEEDDQELREFRRPVRARARGHGQVEIHTGTQGRRRRHGSPNRFEEYRKLGADGYEERSSRRSARARDEDEEEDEEDEALAPRSHRAPHAAGKEHPARAHASREDEADDEEDEAAPRREAPEAHRPRQRSHEEEVRIQHFVERALRNYDHSAR